MKRGITYLIITIVCFTAAAQNHRITLGSCNTYFPDFSERKQVFTGMSSNLSFIINRFSIDISVRVSLPKTYYGRARHYTFTDYTEKEVWVYSRGGMFSMSYDFSYRVFRTESEKLSLFTSAGIGFLSHNGYYKTEQFIRIYGGSDNIHLLFFQCNYAVQMIYQMGSIPVFLKLAGNVPLGKREYNAFRFSGYYTAELGIAFPLLKSEPSSQIKKLEY
jgi:hypothetical protein